MVLQTFRQLHSVLKELPRIEILAHQNPEHIGEIRRVTLVQAASFYSVIDGQPEHPVSRKHYGKGADTWLCHPSCVLIRGNVCTVKNVHEIRERKENPADFITFRILEDE